MTSLRECPPPNAARSSRSSSTEALEGLDVPAYRQGLLAATPELPDDPTDEQVDAWIELGELVQDPALRAGLRPYGRATPPSTPRASTTTATVREVEQPHRRLGAAGGRRRCEEGIAADSPAAEPVVAAIVAAWAPLQPPMDEAALTDGAQARALLLEQLEMPPSQRHVERYWQLLCVINGCPYAPAWPRRATG